MTDLVINDLKERMDKMEGKIDTILQKFEDLEKKYVTRLEFKAVAAVFGVVVAAIWVILKIVESK